MSRRAAPIDEPLIDGLTRSQLYRIARAKMPTQEDGGLLARIERLAADKEADRIAALRIIPRWLCDISNSARKRSVLKSLPYDLTDEMLLQIMHRAGGKCEVSGIEFTLDIPTNGKRRPFYASLDRRIPALGYTLENTRLVCVIVNIAMNEWGEKPLYKLAAALRKKQKAPA